MSEIKLDFAKQDGLVPVIVTDYQTGQVLMLAYMNEEAYHLTLETKQMHYWSRSRQEIWHKGATSGHYQYVKSIKTDCDCDTLLVAVKQEGAACHTGAYSCFSMIFCDDRKDKDMLETLYKEAIDRKENPKEGSYTNYLFDKGLDKILKKVGEEATEVVIAAKNADKDEIANETADVLYHLAVMLVETGVSIEDVDAVLKARQGKKSNVHDRPEITNY